MLPTATVKRESPKVLRHFSEKAAAQAPGAGGLGPKFTLFMKAAQTVFYMIWLAGDGTGMLKSLKAKKFSQSQTGYVKYYLQIEVMIL